MFCKIDPSINDVVPWEYDAFEVKCDIYNKSNVKMGIA